MPKSKKQPSDRKKILISPSTLRRTIKKTVHEHVNKAWADRLWHILEDDDSRWISLKNRLILIDQVLVAKVTESADDLPIAVLALIKDMRADYKAVTDQLEAEYGKLESVAKAGAR